MLRWLALLVCVSPSLMLAPTVIAGAEPSPAPTASSPAPLTRVRYQAPLEGSLRVLHPFLAPVTRYSAGHRGADLASVSGQPVRAAAAGVVSFAGELAGRGVVVLVHADGVHTEYEPVSPSVIRGATVMAGQPIGVVNGAHSDCGPGGCLHWGASRDDTYIDPLGLLRPLGVVHLVPSD